MNLIGAVYGWSNRTRALFDLAALAGFGFAHAYQGPANLPRLMLVGAVFSGLYLLSGSLWLPIVLHTAIDVFQGRVAYTVIQRTVKPAAG